MSQILHDMPNADYHASPAISKSGLDKIARSPAHYRAAKESAAESTEAMIFGSAFHDYILLPEVFQTAYTVLPEDFNGRTKDGKSYLETIKASGQTILKAEWLKDIQGMAAAVAAHPKAAALLTGGHPEVSIFWQDADTGIDCRCRSDYIHSSGIIADLKSTADASPAAFSKSCANFRYHVQDAFYSEGYYQAAGTWPRGFVFIAVEKTAPYAVACYTLDDVAKEKGRELYQQDLQTLQAAQAANEWPAYSDQIETLTLPVWALR
jgi:exodeoxyribonuclease VIII